jgi:hypothetical protein
MAGVWLGGMNERWLFLYNRFEVERGSGWISRGPATGHLVMGNDFILMDPDGPAVRLESGEMEDMEFAQNHFFVPRPTEVFGGIGNPGRHYGNTVFPGQFPIPEKPPPPVPSLYEWQLRQADVPD